MSNPATNTSTRPMLNTMDENYIGIHFRPKVSDKYKLYLKICGVLNPCSCLFCKAEEIYQSTYYQVLENRIEWNTPGLNNWGCCSITCCSKLEDNFGALYFDDAVVNKVERLGCCTPIPCVTGLCPTYCDICGEGMIIYTCTFCGFPLLCFQSKDFYFLEDANTFRDQLREAIKIRKDAGGAPAPVMMSN